MEFRDDGRLGREVHGGVAVGEVAGDAQTQELVALQVDVLAGVFAAGGAELFLRHLVLAAALGAELLLDLPLDRQAVAVPARHIVDVIAQQEARADHEVLQRLVQGVADVDVAVGVGRAVVQHIERRLLRLTQGAQLAVQIPPLRQDLRADRDVAVGARGKLPRCLEGGHDAVGGLGDLLLGEHR